MADLLTDPQQLLLSVTQAHQGQQYVWGENDCSSFSQEFCKELTGRDIGRTAAEQYTHFGREGQLAEPPRDASGRVDTSTLARQMKPGDLVFFTNTYRPDRSRGNDVTHVMVYAGTNEKGEMLMSGAQKSHGTNIYVFDPNKPIGGYSTSDGRVSGQFCGFGRPSGPLGQDVAGASPINVQAIGSRAPGLGGLPFSQPLQNFFSPSAANTQQDAQLQEMEGMATLLLIGLKALAQAGGNPWKDASRGSVSIPAPVLGREITHA